ECRAVFRMHHRDGSIRWVEIVARPLHDTSGATPVGLTGTLNDVTERVAEVTDQVVAEQAARMAQRIDALGRIAGGVAHDFNNLLGVILGTADLLERDLTSGDVASALHAVDVVRSATERAAALTRRLLDV